jgi:hypothetical protein
MRRMRLAVLALACGVAACAAGGVATESGGPPDLIVGRFVDDYGIENEISATVWAQLPNARYHVVRWRPEAGYLIARNDADNPSEAGRWSRIDWVELDMAPYEWAFCMSAYDAPSAAAAESTRVARPESPRDGCNGHPFSRMRRR